MVEYRQGAVGGGEGLGAGGHTGATCPELKAVDPSLAESDGADILGVEKISTGLGIIELEFKVPRATGWGSSRSGEPALVVDEGGNFR